MPPTTAALSPVHAQVRLMILDERIQLRPEPLVPRQETDIEVSASPNEAKDFADLVSGKPGISGQQFGRTFAMHGMRKGIVHLMNPNWCD